MKKNIMMRLASGLLVAVLLTTCAISGTFAKYVTANTAADSARVAKWGVEVAANGQLFKTEYGADTDATDSDGEKIALTVKSSATPADNLVAPGTRNDDGINFGVTGTPEVAVNVKVTATKTADIVLAAGSYEDPTHLYPTDDLVDGKVKLANDYHPLVFTFTKPDGTATSGTLDDVITEINKINLNFAPNTDLSTALQGYKLTWAWAFENEIDGGVDEAKVDVADTTLGNMMADKMANADYVAPNGSSLNVALDLSIVVTQID